MLCQCVGEEECSATPPTPEPTDSPVSLENGDVIPSLSTKLTPVDLEEFSRDLNVIRDGLLMKDLAVSNHLLRE